MAQAITLTINPRLSDFGEKTHVLRGTAAISGTYAAGGPTLDLTTIPGVPVAVGDPVNIKFWGVATSGYFYSYTAGTNLTDGKVKATVITTATELANGAVPAAITGDTIQFEIVLPKHV